MSENTRFGWLAVALLAAGGAALWVTARQSTELPETQSHAAEGNETTDVLAAPDASHTRAATSADSLANVASKVASNTPRRWRGRVVQSDGQPLPPTAMFVAPPHRSLLPEHHPGGETLAHALPPDGHFEIVLDGDAYDDVAFVTIVGGHGDMTLLAGLVKIEPDSTIVVSAPGADESAPITGTVAVQDRDVQNGDLLLLHTATGVPLSFQWGVSGREVAVHLRVLKTRFADVVGPVTLRLDDHSGLHSSAEFASIDHLVAELAIGFTLHPSAVSVAIPDLAPEAPVLDAMVWATDNARFPKRQEIRGGSLDLTLTPGRYVVRGENPETGQFGTAELHYSGGTTCEVDWAYVAPGPDSCLLRLRHDDQALPGADVTAVLDAPEHEHVQAGWFKARATSGPDGNAYLAGLLPGSYSVRISHPRFGLQEVRIEAPRQASVQVNVRGVASVALQLRLPAAATPIQRLIAHVRKAGANTWSRNALGGDSAPHDYVLRLPPGTYEVVCQGGPYWGRCRLRLDEGQDNMLLPIQLREAPVVSGVVTGPEGGAAGMVVELATTVDGVAHSRSTTDGQGAFRLTSLAATLGPEIVRVRDGAARVIAHEVVGDEMELHICAR